MLKKLAIILTSILYLAMSAGMVVSAHYCMGDLADISLGHNTAEKCDDCGMDNNGCCHDEVKICRITDAHGPVSSRFLMYCSFRNFVWRVSRCSCRIRRNRTAYPFASVIPYSGSDKHRMII
jgi:hypothetical protein